MATQPSLLQLYTQMAEKARLSNLERQKTVESIFDEIIARYGPGGQFGKGYESELATQKVQDVGKTAQRDISRGMYGIRPYEQEWEKTVGSGARLKLEDIRMERLSGAQTGKASFLERIEQPYPDYGPLLAASQAGGANLQSGIQPNPTDAERIRQSSIDFAQKNMLNLGGGGDNYTPSRSTPSTYVPNPNFGASTGTAATPYNAETQKNIYADLLAGETAGTAARTGGSLEQSVFAVKPPQWGGNYRLWKQQMDEYNKSKGLSLSGY